MDNNRYWKVNMISADAEADKKKAMKKAEEQLPGLKAVEVSSVKIVTDNRARLGPYSLQMGLQP